MKLRFSKQKNQAWTMIEVLVVIAIVAVLAVIFVPAFFTEPRVHRSPRIQCVANLKQVNLAFLIWAGDNNGKFPMSISVTNVGAKELIASGDVAGVCLVMSNELSTPKILVCPADSKVIYPTNGFNAGFCNKNISYYVGVDADTNFPQRLMSGDDNFEMGGATVPSGVFQLSTNAPISWSGARHIHVGNIGFADGSVWEVSSSGLREALLFTGLATNRLAIP